MTSGYDSRSRFSTRQKFQQGRKGYPSSFAGSFARVSENVVSYRDNVQESNRVPAEEVDIYNGFNQSPGGLSDYLNPGPRLLSELEASGLVTDDDYKNISRGGIVDNGHPFETTRHEFQTSWRKPIEYVPFGFSANNRYVGYPCSVGVTQLSSTGLAKSPFFFGSNLSGGSRYIFNAGLPLPTSSDLAALGTRAISLCAPAVPEVSASSIFGELARDLPAFPGSTLLRSLQMSGFGDEYLNLVFGLIPTLADAKRLAKVLSTYTQRLHQLRRDAGRPVRRTWSFPQVTRAEILTGADLVGSNTQVIVGQQVGFDRKYSVGSGSSSTQRVANNYYAEQAVFIREVVDTWFSGSFTYVLPELPGVSGRFERYLVEMDRLLGIDLDSSAAWQLSPWSWLVDWFIDVSAQMDVISVNYDSNLVLNYGYAMQQTERSVVHKVVFKNDPALGSTWINTAMRSRSQRRIRANPYGFVLQTDGEFWNAYRLAILGALGLSRR